jgi:DNA helicase-2/ATP-dependent DNA helicase PcrA
VQPWPLSDEQQALVDHAAGHLFAEACPGAGKTRAIVARYLLRTGQEPRKGIALLSFTNAAVDEVRSRCGDRPEALKAPHFVGTFDSFINRFITRPLYVRYYDKTPRFIESWQDSKRGSCRLGGMDGLPSFSLDWFEFDGQLCATLRDDWMPQLPARLLKAFIAANRARIEERATTYCQDLVKGGTVSCSASRAFATGLLQRPLVAQKFGHLLSNRFCEVIVDEAQDCGPEELFILRLLKQYGVAVAAVADLDQSIFGFRRADPAGVSAFARELGTPLALNGNYRSSPAICALNNSLRFGGRTEIATGKNASCALPVLVLEYQNQDDVAPTVDALLAVYDRPRSEAIFIAHREADAQACAGVRGDRDSSSTNAVLGIAWAYLVIRSGSSTPADRLRAIRTVEKALRYVANVDEDESALDQYWLRDAAYRLVGNLDPAGHTARSYAQAVRGHVKQIQWPTGITEMDNQAMGSFLKAPQESAWPVSDEDTPAPFPFATIHSVKGREFPTVIVVLPKKLRTEDGRHVLDHWDQALPSEARRVLYVGASRAQTLLILAVHADHANRVVGLLKRDEVPCELASLSAKS